MGVQSDATTISSMSALSNHSYVSVACDQSKDESQEKAYSLCTHNSYVERDH